MSMIEDLKENIPYPTSRPPLGHPNHNNMDKTKGGLYILVMQLEGPRTISVGKHPAFRFKKGLYFYTGRARNGFQGRIGRHCRQEKKLHWHIDYLLKEAFIKEVWIKPEVYEECGTVRKIKNLLHGATLPYKRFGSSDCRCPGHLIFSPEARPNLTQIRKKLMFRKADIHGHHV